MSSSLSPRNLRRNIRLTAISVALAALGQMASAAILPPVTLAWNQNPESDIAGYDLSYGTVRGTYGTTIKAGLNISTQVSGLTAGVTYYFVVVAYNTAGLRSPQSAEISYQGTIATPNQAPDSTISAPSANVTITTGGTVSFAGSGSDPDGNTPLTYLWNFGSGSGIADSTAQNPGSRQFNNPGTYVVTLTATDSLGFADPTPAQRTITVTSPVANQAPNSTISAPSANVSITTGGTVSFSGSGSDPDGNTPLTYLWNFGSGSGIANSTAQNPGSRQFNTAGTYVVTLTVTDSLGLADPSPAQRTITVTAPVANQAPNSTISAPSANVSITTGGTVSFSGSGSDPDGNTPLTYLWNFGSGSGIANSTAQNPGSRQFNTAGTYVVTLTVTDSLGLADPTPAQRTITVTAPVANQAPNSTISSPSANVSITVGGTVGFSGSGSDPDGNTPLTYLWNFGSGSGFANSSSQNPGLRQFNTPGTFVVTLTVTDSKGLADPTPAQRTITVNPVVLANQAPNSAISSPASNISITTGGSISFSGSGSDPDGDTPLSYRWNFGSGSGITDSMVQNPGSRQFNTPGTYVVTFTVTDSQGLADPSPVTRTITVLDPPPSIPGLEGWIDEPSADISIPVGGTVNFSGRGTDTYGAVRMRFNWNFGAGSGIADSTAQNPGLRQFKTPGTYEVSLTVTDSRGVVDPTPATRTITVGGAVVANQAPDSSIAAPASNVSIIAGGTVSFTGSGSDPDGNTPLSYLWNFGSGSGLANSTSQNPGSRQFNTPGSYLVTLTVTDAKGLADPSPAQRTITVNAPVASNQAPDSSIAAPASNISITAGGSVSFAGSGSDPDSNTPLSYRWNFGGGSGLANSTSQNPGSLQFNTPGTYLVTLTVTDAKGLADPSPAQRTITVNPSVASNQPPDSTISAPSTNLTITAGASVSFSGSGSDPDGNTPLAYRWNFGSGSGITDSTTQNPGSRLFNTPGTYLVTLTVTDAKGLADSSPAVRSITVLDPAPSLPPVPSVPGLEGWIDQPSADVNIAVGGTVVFAGSGTDSYRAVRMKYHWNFGSESGLEDSTLQNPGALQFNTPGTFEVTFTVTDSKGVVDPSPAKRTIRVGAAAAAAASLASESVPPPVTATEWIGGLSYATFTVTKPLVPDGIERTAEVSADLMNWFNGPEYIVVITDDDRILKVRAKNPLLVSPYRYFRLKTEL